MSLSQPDKSLSIGVMSVATNLYLEYWKAMVISADQVSTLKDKITFFVFTDNPEAAESFTHNLSNVNVKVFRVFPYKWPEATLLRYQIFESRIDELNCDILMHLDADMLIASSPWDRIKKQILSNSICLVQHPGFWRPIWKKRIFLYISNPLLCARDLRLKLKFGGIGAWEMCRDSSAHVEKKLRKSYACGGTWFGLNAPVAQLVKTLAENVRRDLDKNIIAIWHDESHLNKWSTENLHGFENPELCFDETYPQLKHLSPSIIAVRKLSKTR